MDELKFFKEQLEAGNLYLNDLDSTDDTLIFCDTGYEIYLTIEDGKLKITIYT